MDEQRIFEVFKFFDRENSGTIGVHEVREAMEQMGINTTIDEVISIFNEVVKKGTADIGFEDFKAILLHGPETKELVNNQNL